MKQAFSDIYQLSLTLDFLHQEIAEITSRIQPQDCGHLKTAVSVLKERVKEVRSQIYKLKSQDQE